MRRSARGFTIAELAFVLAVMGIVVSITVPTGEALIRRARADEAHAILAAIAHQELRHWRDTGAFLACPATGEVPKKATPFAVSDCWKSLGVAPQGEVRFRYSVEVKDGSFTAIAEGDLDGDGVTSDYRWDGRTGALTIREALE
ncbi:MAG: prepilin-type N-terminal cleavage/methylation domain-containing protein [Archangium sp.]